MDVVEMEAALRAKQRDAAGQQIDTSGAESAVGWSALLPDVDPTRRLAEAYELLQTPLGRGEFSVVRLGLRRECLRERVAIKLMPKVKAVAERLRLEAAHLQ